ncbi:MAG: TIGR04211 family SH3 domain-containing protein [Candidatus Competibacteraceae bacterium]|nr:TIGR04211 family SH3 domain-containing protein [Candidatus Competibacteraceae bacterium]
MKRRLFWLLPWAFAAQAPFAQAETRYATDALPVPIQKGPSLEFRIAKMVPGGTPLEVLESDGKGYSRVRTPEGVVGWILSRYLMDQPIPRERVAQLEARVAGFENETRTLREDAKALNATRDSLNRCSADLAAVRKSASQTLAIEQDNREMQQAVTAAREQQRQFQLENESLRNQAARNWFLAGGGVALGGLLMGLLIPRLSWQRRRRWDQL